MGFSLAELKEILQEHDENAITHLQVIEWISQKMSEIERKKGELDQILGTLNWMLEYRMALMNDPEKANSLLKLRHSE